MKKTNLLFKYFCVCFLAIFLLSCGNGFDPRLYNSRRDVSGGDDNDSGTPPPPPPVVDVNSDPFLFPENNNPDFGGFNSAKFDEWTLSTYFDGKNVPIHKFYNYKQWSAGDAATAEYTVSGEDTYTEVVTGSLGKITDVTYIMYKGKNDHFAPDSTYNIEPVNGIVRMERFRFFRFEGKPAAGPLLDNRLMAVDAMTKLVFLYSKPIEFQTVVGQQVPSKWEAVDTATKVSGLSYPFYEYDPIGVVHADGKVELFDGYITDTANRQYDPRIDIANPNRQIASAGKPGRSPYMPVVNDLKTYTLSVTAKSLKNINIKSKYRTSLFDKKWKDLEKAYLTYAIRSSLYLNSEPTYDILSHKGNGQHPEQSIIGTSKIDTTTERIDTGYTKIFSDLAKEYSLVSTELPNYTLELDAIIQKYASTGRDPDKGFVSTWGTDPLNYYYHAVYNNYGAPKIKFVYDENQEAFILDTANSNLDKTTVDTSFTFKLGDAPKDFTINYSNESEIIYTVEFKEQTSTSRRY